MGFENCEVGFGKKMSWEMRLIPLPLQDLLITFSTGLEPKPIVELHTV